MTSNGESVYVQRVETRLPFSKHLKELMNSVIDQLRGPFAAHRMLTCCHAKELTGAVQFMWLDSRSGWFRFLGLGVSGLEGLGFSGIGI